MQTPDRRAVRLMGAVGVLAAALAAGTANAAPTDARTLGDEAAILLAALVRVDTTNPPGAEVAAARVLADRLRADGITAEVFESEPGRGNVHARLPGRGTARPIVLLSHLDVVPADARGWRHPPFAGVRADGWVWGRGTLDAKGVAAVHALALVALKRRGIVLDRDVILLATADEERGGMAGAGWVTRRRPELVAGAEFLLTEGDHVRVRRNARGRRTRVVQVAVGEKTPCWLRLTASGPAGHGSVPPAATAVTRLVRALDRLAAEPGPVRVVPSVERYFAALAGLEEEPLRSRLARLGDALADPVFRAQFTENRHQAALVRATLTPTVLLAGPKTNVIPAEASAEVDARLLPGDDPAAFVDRVRGIVADPAVRVEQILSFPASASDPDSALVHAVERLARTELGGAPVVPSVLAGFTDSHWFRDLGIASYGFVPWVLTEDDQKTVHGIDERVSEANLRDAVGRMVTLLRALDARPTEP
jgi:acetylornithine deacetylase/succinyl-diaminopimelate desuccinylase-like protein